MQCDKILEIYRNHLKVGINFYTCILKKVIIDKNVMFCGQAKMLNTDSFLNE